MMGIHHWTHWGLNPGPSACEADVIPLHHVPDAKFLHADARARTPVYLSCEDAVVDNATMRLLRMEGRVFLRAALCFQR